MRILTRLGVITFAVLVSACTGGPQTTNPATPSPTGTSSALAAFAGTWTSSAVPSGVPNVAGCSAVTFSVTPTGANTAAIAYTATCAGVAASGSGDGTLNGTTLNWRTIGSAGPCAFSLSGTAIPAAASDLSVTHSGTVCGAPVNGSETLHR